MRSAVSWGNCARARAALFFLVGAAAVLSAAAILPDGPDGVTEVVLDYTTTAGYGAAMSGFGAICPSQQFLLITRKNAVMRLNYTLPGAQPEVVAGYPDPPGTLNTGYVDGQGTSARFGDPSGIALDSQCHFAYVADYANNRVRRVELASGAVTTVAGDGTPDAGAVDGPALSRAVSSPWYLAVAADDARLYVMTGVAQLLSLDLASGQLAVAAGRINSPPDGLGGIGTSANLSVGAVVALATGEFVLASDTQLFTFEPASRAVRPLAGQFLSTGTADGFGTAALLHTMMGAVGYSRISNALYFSDGATGLRRLGLASREVTTIPLVATDGVPVKAPTAEPDGLLIDAARGEAFVVTWWGLWRVRLADAGRSRALLHIAGSAFITITNANITLL